MAYSSNNLLKKTWDYFFENGPVDTWQRATSAVGLWLFQRLVHKRVEPSLRFLWPTALSAHTSAAELLPQFLPAAADDVNMRELLAEYDALETELADRYRCTNLKFPAHYAVERGSSFLVYAVGRLLGPEVIVETGVANGVSSFFMLNALLKNGHGTLLSFDVDSQAGSLLRDRERSVWRFEALRRPFKKNFVAALESVGSIDVFLHDSDHWYGWTNFEFSQALPHMRADGVLLCDDADYSLAFPDFCAQHGLKPLYLVETRKVFGIASLRPLSVENRAVDDSQLSPIAAGAGRKQL